MDGYTLNVKMKVISLKKQKKDLLFILDQTKLYWGTVVNRSFSSLVTLSLENNA